MPLYNAVCNHIKKEKANFHMPSHNGQNIAPIFASAQYDLTELSGLDNLLWADGIIKDSENLMAQAYNSDKCLFLTQGSTCGNHIALAVMSQYGKKIAIIGDMHKSFFSGCLIWGLEVIESSLKDVDKILQNEDIVGLFVTSPNYYGQCLDLAYLREITIKTNTILAIDSAHGATFSYVDNLPDSASKYGDIVTMSLHKTLPSYGGGAIVCVKNKYYELACYYRQLIHSTSPSYLIMASMDFARNYMQENAQKEYQEIHKAINEFSNKLTQFEVLKNDDWSRLVIDCNGRDASILANKLEENGIFVEMTYEDRLVMIITLFNYKKLDTMVDICNKTQLPICKKEANIHRTRGTNISKNIEFIEVDKAIGRVSACEVGIYPPGIPLVRCGDILDENVIKIIKNKKSCAFGLVNDRLAVLQ